MKKNQGEKLLGQLFESSAWKEKFMDRVPPDENGVVYKWSAEEAEYAAPFFSRAGQGVITEETCIAKRSLYLGRDQQGTLYLYIYEQEKKNYREGIPEMAREFACMMKVDNLLKK